MTLPVRPADPWDGAGGGANVRQPHGIFYRGRA